MSTETTETRPDRHPTIIELLARVMADISHVGKDGYNKAQSFNFRGIDAVLNAVGPAFRTHGIVPKPILKDVTYEDILVGSNRTPMTRCTVKVKYRFKGPGGDYEDVTVPGEAFDSGDKGTAKAMSVAYRIALIQLLALPTTEPDPDESSYERAPAAVTDQRWLAAVRQRIAAATDHDALNVIGADIGAQADAGQLSMADGNRLRAEFDARWTAVARPPAPASDEWTTPPGGQPPAPTPEAAPAPAAVGTPNNPSITDPQQKMLHSLLNKAGYGSRESGLALIARVLRREVGSSTELSKTEANTVITALTTGELPPQAATPPPGANANGEGIAEFDVLFQLINDAHTAEEFEQARADIEREHAEGGIGGDQLAALQAHWVDVRNERRALAGATT